MFSVFYLQISNCVSKEVTVIFAVLLDQKMRQNDLFQVAQRATSGGNMRSWVFRVLAEEGQNSSSEANLQAGIKSVSKRVIK